MSEENTQAAKAEKSTKSTATTDNFMDGLTAEDIDERRRESIAFIIKHKHLKSFKLKLCRQVQISLDPATDRYDDRPDNRVLVPLRPGSVIDGVTLGHASELVGNGIAFIAGKDETPVLLKVFDGKEHHRKMARREKDPGQRQRFEELAFFAEKIVDRMIEKGVFVPGKK